MIRDHLTTFFDKILDIILPPYCVCCKKTGKLLCDQCYRLIHFNLQPNSNPLMNCEFLDQVCVLALYQPPISKLIQELKYKRVKKTAELLAKLLYYHLSIPETDFITWAPISRGRLNERGFNQAELIAKKLSKLIEVPTINLLIKNKETKKQAKSSLKERITNLEGSFVFNHFYDALIDDASVLIVDDVISTGSTLNECAKILKTAKANKVIGLAVAQS